MDAPSQPATPATLPDSPSATVSRGFGGFPGHGEQAPLELPPMGPATEAQVRDRLLSRDFDAWAKALARVGNCARPIRLHGHSQTVDAATGEVIASYSSRQAPLAVTHVRCGNRRAGECESCSRLYAGDMFHLLHAGIAGGKTVPQSVAENPLVFATLTAPSFGRVHGHRDGDRACHPHTRHAPRCEHGRARTCTARHTPDDPNIGQPLCADCYDYTSHLVWQWWAPALWRRFIIALRRRLARDLGIPGTRLDQVATVQYAKVAEFQARGAVHFHALLRLDGPKTPDGFAPAPPSIHAHTLAAIAREVAATVRLPAPGIDTTDPARTLALGRQVDTRPVRTSRRTDDPDRDLTPDQVAGYLAKYATKSATDDTDTDNPHHRRLRAHARDLADRAHTHHGPEGPYRRMHRWIHMLGFRGHFATKSRRYSLTLGALRRARRRASALIAEHHTTGQPLDLAALEADLLADEHDETTLVIGHWNYAGTGWATDGERVLALAAAARAREYDQWKAQQRRNTAMPKLGRRDTE